MTNFFVLHYRDFVCLYNYSIILLSECTCNFFFKLIQAYTVYYGTNSFLCLTVLFIPFQVCRNKIVALAIRQEIGYHIRLTRMSSMFPAGTHQPTLLLILPGVCRACPDTIAAIHTLRFVKHRPSLFIRYNCALLAGLRTQGTSIA